MAKREAPVTLKWHTEDGGVSVKHRLSCKTLPQSICLLERLNGTQVVSRSDVGTLADIGGGGRGTQSLSHQGNQLTVFVANSNV